MERVRHRRPGADRRSPDGQGERSRHRPDCTHDSAPDSAATRDAACRRRDAVLSREEYRAKDAVGLADLVRSGVVTAQEVLEAAIAEQLEDAAPWIRRRPPQAR